MASKRKVNTKYITQACDFCKQRHLKCDGQPVCFQCKKRKNACQYTQHNVKRGPKPRKKQKEWNTFVLGNHAGVSNMENVQYIPSLPLGRDPELLSTTMFTQGISIQEPSIDMTIAALEAFSIKVAPINPHNFVISPQIAFNVWHQLAINYQFTKLGELVDAFLYSVIFAHGLHLIGHDALAMDFAIKLEKLLHVLFFSPSTLSPANYTFHADVLVSALLLLGVFRIEFDDFNNARLCFTQAYNVLNMHINEVSPHVAHRLYAHLAGMSRSTADMGHWLSNAHSLGPEAATPVNRVMLSLLYCTPSMLRDPKNKPLPTNFDIPISHTHIKQKDMILYQRMLRELDETEVMVWEQEPTIKQENQFSPHSELNSPPLAPNFEHVPPETAPLIHNSPVPANPIPNNGLSPVDCMTSYRIIIDGCRALVLAQCGYPDQALQSAEKCINFSKILQARVLYWGMPLGLAYALMTCKALNHQVLFQEGISIMEIYASFFPFVPHMLQILTAKLPSFTLGPRSPLSEHEETNESHLVDKAYLQNPSLIPNVFPTVPLPELLLMVPNFVSDGTAVNTSTDQCMGTIH